MVYFDYNATAPLSAIARQAWMEASENFIGNPSSPHRIGARAEVALNSAREKLAAILGCNPLDIVWTSGATESNNMVLHHFAHHLDPKVEVWVSAIEHPCVLEVAKKYFPGRYRLIPAQRSGIIDLNWLEHQLEKLQPGLIAVMAGNNETGVLQPWRKVLALCQKFKIPYFCDAVQWIGRLPAKGLNECEFVSGCAHKVGGPKGVGFLKCPSKTHVHPLIRGGKQEEGRRAGTENLAGIISMVAVLEARHEALSSSEIKQRIVWRQTVEKNLLRKLPGAQIVGKGQKCLWNTVSALMPETENNQRWVVKLDKLGFAVSTGSACASGREEPSHVLAAMGYKSAEADRVLRFSSGWETTEDEWNALLEGLVKVHKGKKENYG